MKRMIVLETERLLLRPFKKSEAALVVSNSRQPSVAIAMSDMVLADEKAGLDWIRMIRRSADLKRPCQILAVELKEEKKCVGIIGVIPQSKIQGEMEILFSIADPYQNRGFATEACEKIIEWFFSLGKHTYLCAIVKTDNTSSQRVIEKCGFDFVETREIMYDGEPTMFKYYRLYSS